MNQPDQITPEQADSETVELSPLVLIVDDDVETLLILSLLLKRLGVQIKQETNAKASLEWLEAADRLHLIILDLKLPDMDGAEVLRLIRANQKLDSVPVMILSGKSDPATIRQMLSSGADDYLTKPYQPNNLLAHAEALIFGAD